MELKGLEVEENQENELKESIKERNTSFINTLEQQAKEFSEKHPEFDMLTLSKRPEDMSWELYRFVRKISNKTLYKYVRR